MYKKLFIGKYDKSVLLSYIGVLSAGVGIILSFNGYISYAMICLIVSAICDLFDGKVARMCKTRDEMSKEYGKELDSLCDVVSFLVLPLSIVIAMAKNVNALWFIGLPLYVMCGVIRLSWFNSVTAKEEKIKFYTGVPVTYIALLLPLLYSIDLIFKINFVQVYIIALLVSAVLFVSNIKIPKPKGVWYIIFSVLALIVGTLILILG